MSFGVLAALAVALLVGAPFVAHFLQRGRTEERELPTAFLVPVAPSTSRKRRRLEDRALFGVRSAMVLALAVLGATPLMRCDRLALTRDSGGSVALALVLDDSHSMRARLPSGGTRWAKAHDGARSLLASARDGDSIAIVLAGHPARIALAATTDLGAARMVLDRLELSDRSTDLPHAVALARSALQGLPQADRRVAVLSDLADDPIPDGSPPIWTPLPELTEPTKDCGIVQAFAEGRRSHVTLACQWFGEPQTRTLKIAIAPEGTSDPGKVIAETEVPIFVGERTLTLEHPPSTEPLDAFLSANAADSIEANDRAPVAPSTSGLGVAVLVDRALASARTGGASLLEQALAALVPPPRVRPLPLAPRDPGVLASTAVLILDDPPGLSPEARTAITEWARSGGIALALLGPRATSAQLASTLEPFTRGPLRWEGSEGDGLDVASAHWLGPEAESLADLTRGGRARIDAAVPDGARLLASWSDGAPFAFEQPLGRGLLFTLGLPTSVDQSDFALRPGFLAILDHVLTLARRRSSQVQSPVGERWNFAGARRVHVEGPTGPLPLTPSTEDTTLGAVPDRIGRYRVVVDGSTEARIATLAAAELLTQPRETPSVPETTGDATEAGHVDVSREVALFLLLLLLLELVLRGMRRRSSTGRLSSAAHQRA
jgi:hypothetical protein